MSRGSVTPADIYLEHSHHAVNVEANCDRLSRIRWIRSGSCNGYQGGKDRRWSRCVGLDPDESLDPRMDHAIVGIVSGDVEAEQVGLALGDDSRVEAG